MMSLWSATERQEDLHISLRGATRNEIVVQYNLSLGVGSVGFASPILGVTLNPKPGLFMGSLS